MYEPIYLGLHESAKKIYIIDKKTSEYTQMHKLATSLRFGRSKIKACLEA